MLIPIIVLFIAHEFITGNFDIIGKPRAMTEHSTKIYLWPSSVLNTFVKHTPGFMSFYIRLTIYPKAPGGGGVRGGVTPYILYCTDVPLE